MKFEKIIIALIISVTLYLCVETSKQKEYKYQIVSSNGITFLLDKENGNVWRNTVSDNKQRIPNNWELMTYSERTVPEGEEERKQIDFERLLKNSGVKR